MSDSTKSEDHGIVTTDIDEALFQSRAFRRLERRLERDLRKLVARWAPFAAPRASKVVWRPPRRPK